MAIVRLRVKDFTLFRDAAFEFAPGINVLIGENATGKSHVLKLLYAVEYAIWRQQPEGRQAARIRFEPLAESLDGVFRVRNEPLDALVRRDGGQRAAEVKVDWDNGGWIWFKLSEEGVKPKKKTDTRPATAIHAHAQLPVFLPTREILSVFPGFAETLRNRELEFDDTYMHLADALNLPAMKGEALKAAAPFINLVEKALGGKESKKEGRFFVTFSGERFEAHLVAEGLRKIATIARLIRNGRIAPGTLLFWDEPEANLNPVLLRKVVDVLLALAGAGVQIFLASHDYLLTQTLSLAAEHPRARTPAMRFFGLSRDAGGSVTVEHAETLADIQHNPIMRSAGDAKPWERLRGSGRLVSPPDESLHTHDAKIRRSRTATLWKP